MIEAENLTKNYGPIRAVDRVSFLIPSGQVFGLLGPNGAGKTTTIKMLTTLSIPDAGRCSIDGFDVVGEPMAVKMRIGVVPQENNLDRDLTPLENLQIYARLHRVKDPRGRDRIPAAASRPLGAERFHRGPFLRRHAEKASPGAGPPPETAGPFPGRTIDRP